MTDIGLTLRLATVRDAQAIAIMSRERIEAGLGWRYRPEQVCRLINRSDTVVLVACKHSRLVGFAIMEFGDEMAHLVLLAVQPEDQRQGTGRRLLEWLLDSAATAGIAAVHLELRASNTAARSFYCALGFSETTRVADYYGRAESAIRMRRVLRIASLSPFRWQPPRLDQP